MTSEAIEAVLAGRERWVVALGDCRELMATLPAGSIDAVVCDPPYGLEFMGQEWDRLWDDRAHAGFGDEQVGSDGVLRKHASGRPGPTYVGGAKAQAWHLSWATQALRVLKPGGHLIAMGGTRTFHRLASAIEDAGFEIRDATLAWVYGSGFPKSYNIGEDLGTGLKPAWEPIVVSRKPIDGTVAENVHRFGTGALNITATRVGFAGQADESETKTKNAHAQVGSGPMTNQVYGEFKEDRSDYTAPGRWPPNALLVHDPSCKPWSCAARCPVAEMDRQSPVSTQTERMLHDGHEDRRSTDFRHGSGDRPIGHDDSGGASRFFPRFGWDDEERSFIYVPKASRSEREAGLGPGTGHTFGPMAGRGDGIKPVGLKCRKCGRWKVSGNPCSCAEPDFEALSFERRTVANRHPTVKPIALMRWLVRLVTPIAGVVLDPFAGSGTTGCGVTADGFRFVGIEAEAEYVALAEARIRYWQGRPESQVPSHVLLTGKPPGQLRLEHWIEESS